MAMATPHELLSHSRLTKQIPGLAFLSAQALAGGDAPSMPPQ